MKIFHIDRSHMYYILDYFQKRFKEEEQVLKYIKTTMNEDRKTTFISFPASAIVEVRTDERDTYYVASVGFHYGCVNLKVRKKCGRNNSVFSVDPIYDEDVPVKDIFPYYC